MTEFEIIPIEALGAVAGGGSWTQRFQKLYKWWTHTKKPTSTITPKEIYGEGKRILRDIGFGVGAVYGAKKGIDKVFGSGTEHDATAPSSHPASSGGEE